MATPMTAFSHNGHNIYNIVAEAFKKYGLAPACQKADNGNVSFGFDVKSLSSDATKKFKAIADALGALEALNVPSADPTKPVFSVQTAGQKVTYTNAEGVSKEGRLSTLTLWCNVGSAGAAVAAVEKSKEVYETELSALLFEIDGMEIDKIETMMAKGNLFQAWALAQIKKAGLTAPERYVGGVAPKAPPQAPPQAAKPNAGGARAIQAPAPAPEASEADDECPV